MSVQVRVILSKNNELVDGPDGAELVLTVGAADARLPPATAFMQGKLKNTGPTSALLTALRDGSAADALSRLASQF